VHGDPARSRARIDLVLGATVLVVSLAAPWLLWQLTNVLLA